MRSFYIKAYSGDVRLSYSIWNIGEVLGVIDKARELSMLEENGFKTIRGRFLRETRRGTKLGIAIVAPVKTRILMETWRLLETHHIYEADALQTATAKHLEAEVFLTEDRNLHETAPEEHLNSTYLR